MSGVDGVGGAAGSGVASDFVTDMVNLSVILSVLQTQNLF